MRSRHHAPISALVGVTLTLTVVAGYAAPLVVVYATLLGTFVDLDHFLIARVRTGSWEALQRCLRDPRMALFEQDRIFERGAIGEWTRLGSHAVLTLGLTGLLWALAPELAVVTLAVLAVHMGCDVAWDTWRRQTGRIRGDDGPADG